ncbi:MAG: hypothetical protein NDI61_00160 [Bdellovibrionaceae bacterium]|nr:hypothetical protein [Pseudobdellovibrionaceae bacterium]
MKTNTLIVTALVWSAGSLAYAEGGQSFRTNGSSFLPSAEELQQQCLRSGGVWGVGDSCVRGEGGGGDTSNSGANAAPSEPGGIESEGETGVCESAYDRARLACDPLSGAGLSADQSALVEAAVQGTAMAAGSMANAGKSPHEMCSAAEGLTKVMMGIQGSRAVACKAMQSRCLSVCEGEITTYTNALSTSQLQAAGAETVRAQYEEQLRKSKSHRRACNAYEESFARQLMQAQQYANSMLQSRTCAEMTKNQAVVAQSGTPNCADETVKRTNPYCICQSNPRDARCGYNPGASGTLGGGGGAAGGIDGTAGLTSLGDSALDGEGMGPGGIGSRNGANGSGSNNGMGAGGGGGGGPSLIGGSGFGGGAGGGGAGGVRAGTQVIQGVSGGGSFAGYGRPGGNGEGSGGNSSWMSKLKAKFNIKDALPDKNKLARGLAGMGANAAADGITGAMGESIWQKASRQYRSQERGGGFLK